MTPTDTTNSPDGSGFISNYLTKSKVSRFIVDSISAILVAAIFSLFIYFFSFQTAWTFAFILCFKKIWDATVEQDILCILKQHHAEEKEENDILKRTQGS